MENVRDGIIELGQAPAAWGFTADRFVEGSYLWKSHGTVTITLIGSVHQGRGYFKHLVQEIERDGYDLEVPTPLAEMRRILSKWGWKKGEANDPEMGLVEVWRAEKHRATG